MGVGMMGFKLIEKFYSSPDFLISWGEDVQKETFNIFSPTTSKEKNKIFY